MAESRSTSLTSGVSAYSAPTSLPYEHPSLRRRVWFALLNLGVLVLFTLLAQLLTWGTLDVVRRPKSWPMMGLFAAGFLVSLGLSLQWKRFNRESGYLFTVFSVVGVYLVIIGVIFMTRAFYARRYVVTFFLSTLFWCLVVQAINHRQSHTLALIPGEVTDRLRSLGSRTRWVSLDEPELRHAVDGVVADFHHELPDRWARFVSRCHVRGIPVFTATSVYEFYTGRVNLDHLSEDLVEGFALSRLYLWLRRLIELSAMVVVLPLLLPLMGAVALAIWTESGRPILFTQTRVGQGGNLFEMLKFRSMEFEADEEGPRFASESDQRVTRVGSFIRQYRLDELPQLWNVLMGEMSIIGPRPEQVPFAEEFEEGIPFYPYRHMVRPGITGWAQVNQGYVADTDRTYEKLAYDLYYLKYFSPWLDMLIVYRTLHIILTGFGAR